ncbi:hypothetical protein GCM10022626_09840 [[Pseudomonas] carboxydohydrogena]
MEAGAVMSGVSGSVSMVKKRFHGVAGAAPVCRGGRIASPAAQAIAPGNKKERVRKGPLSYVIV